MTAACMSWMQGIHGRLYFDVSMYSGQQHSFLLCKGILCFMMLSDGGGVRRAGRIHT